MTTSVGNNSVFKSFFEKQKLTGPNFIDWYRQLRLVLSTEDKENYLEHHIPVAPVAQLGQQVPPEALAAHAAWVKGQKEVATVREFHTCKQEEGQSVSSHVLKMKGYIDNLERPGQPVGQNLAVSLILVSLNKDFASFVQNFNMHGMGKTRVQIKSTKNKPHKAAKRGHGKGKGKMGYAPNNAPFAPKPKTPPPPKKDNPAKDVVCHQCGEVGHWRRNCPVYLAELMKKKKLSQEASTSGIFTIELYSFPSKSWIYDTGCGTHICITTQGLRGSKKLKPGALSLYVGDGHRAAVEAIGTYHLELPSGLVIVLNNCHYAPSITRGVISVSRLFDDGFINRFDDNNVISVSKNNLVYFMAVPRDGIFEIDMSCSNANDSSIMQLKVQLDGLLNFLLTLSHRNSVFLACLSFWDYALESAARILNMVPTKKVDKTPYEIWHGQAPKLSYLKVWGCEAFVKHDTLTKPNKLDPRSFKSIFIGYPKETMGYSFYSPSENKVFVARNAEFLESKLLDLKSKIDGKSGEPLTHKPALLDPEFQEMDLVAMNTIAAYYDYEIWQMDVKTAFLNGYLSEEFYMEQPEGYKDVKSYLGRSFAMKDLGDAAYILGIKIYRDRSKRLIGLNQSDYIEKILKSYCMENSKRGTIPMQEKLKLSKSQGASTPTEKQRMQNIPYASAIGSIMYAVRCTRPDVAFAQNMTSRFQQNPGEEHWTAVKNILKYLRNTKDMFLVYGGNMERELRVSCYTDAGYLTDADNLKSYALSWKPCQGDSLNLPDHRAQVDQESQIKMIQVKEMMQDNDLKNSKSKDKGSRSRSQSMNEQSHYKQDKTKTRQSINVKSHIFNVIGSTEEFEERDLNIGGDC
ncbi:zinc finger, CCHC-type containing protein [Tanacetum coccineum]